MRPSSRFTNCSESRPPLTHSPRVAPVTRSRAVKVSPGESFSTVCIVWPLASTRRAPSLPTMIVPSSAGPRPFGSTTSLPGAVPILCVPGASSSRLTIDSQPRSRFRLASAFVRHCVSDSTYAGSVVVAAPAAGRNSAAAVIAASVWERMRSFMVRAVRT